MVENEGGGVKELKILRAKGLTEAQIGAESNTI